MKQETGISLSREIPVSCFNPILTVSQLQLELNVRTERVASKPWIEVRINLEKSRIFKLDTHVISK